MTDYAKDPADKLDYAIDWSQWIEAPDTVTASTWVAAPTGIVAVDPPPSVEDGKAIVWLSGGTVGTAYAVTNHVTTAMGRIVERTFHVHVMDR